MVKDVLYEFQDLQDLENSQIREGTLISNIVKEYPHMFKIVIYHDDYRLNPRNDIKALKVQQKTVRSEYKLHASVIRSQSTVKDIIQCNDWDFWVTFTFSPKKVENRFNYDACAHKMKTWLRNQYSLRYIVVPEFHKRCQECVDDRSDVCVHADRPKALHFHALLANYQGSLKDSGKKTKYGQPILHGNYRSGHNEFVRIDENTEWIAKYMTKTYMTKDMQLLSDHRRFWASQNLSRPKKHINGLTKYKLWSLVKNQKPQFINQSYEVHYIKKDDAFNQRPLTISNQSQLF